METEEEAARRRRAGFEVINGLGEFAMESPSFLAMFPVNPSFAIGLHMAMAIAAAMEHPEWGQAIRALTIIPTMPEGLRAGGLRELVEAVPVGGVA